MNARVDLDQLLPELDHRHLDWLEEEAIFILREVAASSSARPCCFRAARTPAWCCAWPRRPSRCATSAAQRLRGRLPFPLLHVDTGHNFPEVIAFRDQRVAEMGERLVVGHLEDSIAAAPCAWPHPLESRNGHQTVTLLEAIEEHRFDCLIGGARRDEEKARAKERIFSHRDGFGQWQPKEQRPELWTCSTPATAPASTSAPSRSATGPSSTCGCTSPASASRCPACTTPRARSGAPQGPAGAGDRRHAAQAGEATVETRPCAFAPWAT
jgi:hypothetical protein